MALAMLERGDPIDGLLVTPTGNELPELWEHWAKIAELVGAPTIKPKGPSLDEVIRSQRMLPNFRARFCTRMIKVVPVIAWCKSHPGAVMNAGIRADEEERTGIFSRSVTTRFPLQEYDMGLPEVLAILRKHRIKVPRRTDCAICYHQRIGEWYELWLDHPDLWAEGERYEADIGATFRSPGRDSWPLAMVDLAAEFARGRVPASILRDRRGRANLTLFDEFDDAAVCRVCSL